MDGGRIFSTANRPANYQVLSIFISADSENLFYSRLFPASRFRHPKPSATAPRSLSPLQREV